MSKLVLIAFPLGLIGAIAKSYTMAISNDKTFDVIGIWDGLLIGIVTTVFFLGFIAFVHFKLFPVPDDLFTGPMFEKTERMFQGGPSIFRQGLACMLCCFGAGLGFMISALTLNIGTLGTGVSEFIPGIAGSALIITLWKSQRAQ